MLSAYRPYNKAAFLALIPPSFTSLNPFVTFFRPLQPHSSSHNWVKYENSRFKSDVHPPEQNIVFCDCFASFQLTKTFILKLKCSAFIRNTSFTDCWKGRLKNWVFVLSVRILVPSGYWATYCNGKNVQKLWKNRCFLIKLTILTL